MYQYNKIKLIIWDFDETFWKGTLSEGDVIIPDEHIKLIKDLTDAGIVNSICSKNDWESVKTKLNQVDLLDYFVFPSVNWEPKGQRIKELIADMQLRPANVLFLDDNHSNREEAAFYCKGIMTGSPKDIPDLIMNTNAIEKKDLEHKRLDQYHVLEAKAREKQSFSSNEDFLYSSNIKLDICFDCENQLERIHDLILRSNQLNFTKIRSTQTELQEIIQDETIQTAYIEVHDRFGDYGVIGFYALSDNKLIHFVFSCRTLGMGIEQYVYNYLGRPRLEISGEVISDLSSKELPKWINQKESLNQNVQNLEINGLKEHMVLIKGPCDLFQIYPYIANTDLFDTDFTHTTDSGVLVDSTSHTTHIVESKRLSDEQKKLVEGEVPFFSAESYNDSIFSQPYRVAIISILDDANLGVYKRKLTGERFAFSEYLHSLTNKENWNDYITGNYSTSGFRFTKDVLESFSKKYEFMGRNTPEQIVENLSFIRQNLSTDCKLCIMLGGELPYEKNTFEAYIDRHLVHKQINDAIRAWAKSYDNVNLIDVNKYLVDQNSFYDHFNHYIKPVYYALAQEIVDIVNETLGTNIKEKSKIKMIQIRAKEILASTYYKLLKIIKR